MSNFFMHKLSIALITCLALTGGAMTVQAAERTNNSPNSRQSVYQVPSVLDYINQLPEERGSTSPSDADVIYVPWTYPPLHYFESQQISNFTGDSLPDSMINAYLLSYLSDAIYSDSLGNGQAWVDEYRDHMEAFGAESVAFHANTGTGAEVAAIKVNGGLIIVHRGSHYNGTPLLLIGADWIHDLDDDAIPKTIGGEDVYVHEGFWNTADSVYDWVLAQVEEAHQEGRRIWFTGHSLGAANATLIAARINYEEGIPVQGLHTFGSPKVGNSDFQKLLTYEGADGVILEDVTHRFVVEKDKVTTLFVSDKIPYWYTTWTGYSYLWYKTVYYAHVGATHQIYPSTNGIDFDVDYYAADRSTTMPAPLTSLLHEHGLYTPGLTYELMRILEAADMEFELEDILDGQ